MGYLRACLLGPGILPYLRVIDPGSCAPASENRPEGSGKDARGRGGGGGDALAGALSLCAGGAPGRAGGCRESAHWAARLRERAQPSAAPLRASSSKTGQAGREIQSPGEAVLGSTEYE